MGGKIISAMLRVFGICLCSVSTTGAAPLSPFQEVIEVLMDAQGANATLIARSFGPDSNSVLSFTANVQVGQSFSYSSTPGLTYLGQPLSVTTSGIFNTSTNAWEMTSSGSLGGTSLSGTGREFFDDAPPQGEMNWIWGPLDYRSFTTYPNLFDPTLPDSESAITLTILGIPFITGITSIDTLRHDDLGADWQWVLPQIELVLPSGARSQTRIDSKSATFPTNPNVNFTFTTQIQEIAAIPEPASYLLFSIGLLGFAGHARRKRKLIN
jgi:hypothetical protein